MEKTESNPMRFKNLGQIVVVACLAAVAQYQIGQNIKGINELRSQYRVDHDKMIEIGTDVRWIRDTLEK